MQSDVTVEVPFVLFEGQGWRVLGVSKLALTLLDVFDEAEVAERVRAVLTPEGQAAVLSRVPLRGGTLRFPVWLPKAGRIEAWAQPHPSGWALVLMPQAVELAAVPPPSGGGQDALLSAIPTPACTVSGAGNLYSENAAWRMVPACQRNPAKPITCSEQALQLSGCGLRRGEVPPQEIRFIQPKASSGGFSDFDLGRCGAWRIIDGRSVGYPIVLAFERALEGGAVLAARARTEISRMAEEIQSLREEERAAVARELHDGLGQELAVLNLMSFGLKRKLQSEQDQGALIPAVVEFLTQLDTQARRIVDEIGRASCRERV